MKNKIALRFGIMNDNLIAQLKAQGFICDMETCNKWEDLRFAINSLKIAGLLSEKETHNAFTRLLKKIAKGVKAKRAA